MVREHEHEEIREAKSDHAAAHRRLSEEAWSKSKSKANPEPLHWNQTVPASGHQASRLSETASVREVNFFKHAGMYPDDIAARQNEKLAVKGEQAARDKKQQEEIVAVKHLINAVGADPADVLKKAAADSRVVAMGEPHVDGQSPQRLWAATMMKELKQQGITHLAVEFPSAAQKIFDKFNSGSRGTSLEVPSKLGAHDSDDTAMMLKGLDRLQQQRPDLMTLWKAARDSGIKLVAVDNMSVYMNDSAPGFKALYLRRDSDMKNTVMKVLGEDPHNKVLAWLGGFHMARAHNTGASSTFVEQISAEFKRRGHGEKITTFFGATNEHTDPDLSTQPFADGLKRPVSVNSHDLNSQGLNLQQGAANELGRLPVLRDENRNRSHAVRLEHYDAVLLFPGHR